jgi:YD repeat-containing protein
VVAKVKGVNVTRKVSRVKYSKNGSNEATSGDGYFPWEILNALSHTVSIQTEPAIGQPTKVSQQLSGNNYADVNNTFDALGRPLTTSAENSPTMHLRYSLATTTSDSLAPAHSVTKVTSYQAGSPTTRVYQDLLGRELRTATEGFSGDWITTDKRYDLQGNTTFESIPKAENGTLYGVTYLGFDILGRPATKETQQDCGLLKTNYSHSGLNTTITANDTCSGGKTISMSRSYNSLKQLVETVDGNNGITRYAYNSLGLPIVIRDASNTDAGTIIAKYNV